MLYELPNGRFGTSRLKQYDFRRRSFVETQAQLERSDPPPPKKTATATWNHEDDHVPMVPNDLPRGLGLLVWFFLAVFVGFWYGVYLFVKWLI